MTDRITSYWGWGWADRFPDASVRRAVGGQVAALLGIEAGEPGEPVPLEEARLPPARLEAPGALEGLVDASRRARAAHTYGKGFADLVRGFDGDFASAPDLVATPRTETDVERVLEWAAANRTAVIPYGGGTSVVGGVEPKVPAGYSGTLSLDLGRLDRVLEVDEVSRAARIQAGATGPVLEDQLRSHDLSLRHYPQSFEFSTLGGWIATRAAGHHATLRTHIDERVESVRMLTPTGWWESLRVPGSGAGPSPDRMVIGSEGTLGVITEAWMRVVRRPRWRAKATALFPSFEAGALALRHLSQSGLYPANCRLLDGDEALQSGVSMDGRAVVLLAFESSDHPLTRWLERALEIVRQHGGEVPESSVKESEAQEVSERDSVEGRWRDAFFEMPYLFNTLVSLGLVVDTFETACTWDRFPALDAGVRAAVGKTMQEVCGGGSLTCRFTHVYPDGPAPYYTFVAPGRAGGRLEQWEAIRTAAGDAVAAHGGTITHHHAVGRLHRPWYERQRPEPFGRVLAAAKRTVDPDGLLNPGVLLDPSGG